ncbi:MAG: exopolyphosphatase, partial [Myxococcota bacterium]
MTRPMAAVAVPPEATPDVVAGIDLGSNSFHMIVVRAQKDGRVHILDRIKEPVRLADGLTKGRELDGDAQARGLDALNRFSQRLASFPRASVRAVGTNTLRMAKNGPEFLLRARESLGHDIDIISGPEEARLIYLGVSHSSWFPGPRLVMDVGGGSTELIVGEGYTADLRDSLFMGCVSYSKRFFERGRLREEGFDAAEVAAKLELRGIAKRYQAHGWERATGASGTLKAIDTVIREEGW